MKGGKQGPGRGPKRGAPNAGRPPSEVRAAALAAYDTRIAKLEGIIDAKTADPRNVVSAMGELRQASGITRLEITGPDGGALEVEFV